MKVKATPVKGRDLKAGDLFSVVGPEYWQGIDAKLSIGERLYVRTNAPADAAPDGDADVWLIEIDREQPAPEPPPQRYILNGQFGYQGETYWRVDDMQRMVAEEAAGTFSPLANLTRFGIAINCNGLTADQARAIVDAVNLIAKEHK